MRREDLFRGVRVGFSAVVGLCVCHLLFAYDTILFCDANPKQILYTWKWCWLVLKLTGLEVNLGNSEMVLVGEVQNMLVLADISAIRLGICRWLTLVCLWGLPSRKVGLESYYREREDGAHIISLEETLFVTRGKFNVNEEYTIEATYLLSLTVHHFCKCDKQNWVTVEKFSFLGGGASFGVVGWSVLSCC